MTRASPFPESLGHAFRVGAALDAGIKPGSLRRVTLMTPHHGVRSLRAPASLLERCHALATVMSPSAAFSHVTAALLLGIPLPYAAATGPLHITDVTDRPRMRRPGVRSHRGAERRQVLVVSGLRVVSAADTWVDLGGALPLGDLIAAGDAVATRAGGIRLLCDALARGAGRSGMARARLGLRAVRLGAASPPETSLRLLVLRHGLPEPELNVDVIGDHGEFLGVSDLVWRQTNCAVEYQGGGHREAQKYEADRQRVRDYRRGGWGLIEVTKADLRNQPERLAYDIADELGVDPLMAPLPLEEVCRSASPLPPDALVTANRWVMERVRGARVTSPLSAGGHNLRVARSPDPQTVTTSCWLGATPSQT